ncbi:MAG: hypothetical protein QM791_23630 [Ferruginibacter sp.]
MMSTRSKYYTRSRKTAALKKSEIKNHPDSKIDQDFPGFPHGHSSENIIKPETETDKKLADIHNKDGEKIDKKKYPVDESFSDGSGGAFNATEEVKE